MTDKVDVIIFSKDRAMQLEALLYSMKKYIKNTGTVYVIVKRTNNSFLQGYFKFYNNQSKKTVKIYDEDLFGGFKKTLITVLSIIETKKILLLCDDIIFTDEVDLNVYNPWLSWNSINLCLGTNITFCNATQKEQKVPEYNIYKDLIRWKWKKAEGDFAYPNSIGASIFKTWWIKILAKILPYDCPNWLEGKMNNKWVKLFISKRTVSYYESKACCLLLNQVQTVYDFQKGLPENSPEKLNELFLNGKVIDISGLDKIKHSSIMVPETYLKIVSYGDRK
jgi:hypothetical protein